MLEQRDLDAIRAIMKEEIAEPENLILKKLDRVQIGMENQIDAILSF